ncbi:DUF1294 domain-containing protein [Zhongshania guokunii]|uniref:DUF1294 domain-containing protein n=1 Tax=Zhongshania guokunii TaxID=641783 RepID=A0ABV3U2Z0_9GAMM
MKIWYLPIVLLAAGLAYSYWLGYTPPLIALIYFVGSVIAYSLYAKDKRAAVKGAWRVQESTLHISALLCGWPGAIIAQQRLRHKTKKVSFRVVFTISLLLNLSLLAWLHSPAASHKLHDYGYKFDQWVATQFGGNKYLDILLAFSRFHTRR